MLVLSRKSGERLYIADNIEVTILSVQGGRVRLGVSAPDSVTIHRVEVQHRIRQEQKVACPATVASALSIKGATTCP